MESARHPNIEIITQATLGRVSGSAGDFTVEVHQKPRYLDQTKCTACGVCADYCPVLVPDPYEENLSLRKAIYIPYTQAAPAAFAVEPEYCLFLSRQECKQCTRTCQAGAINFEQKPEVLTYQVGALILCPGFKSVDPARLPARLCPEAPNVVTGKEFERLCSASGPYLGRILRPSDLTRPRKIAFVQCAGSREKAPGLAYCSSVCCKYALKDALVALEHEPDLEITLFFQDLRLAGKGFEALFQRARAEGVRFVRSRVSEIQEDPETRDLRLKYVTEDGVLEREAFDLVVLAHGLEAPEGNSALALAAGFELNEDGFCQTALFSPLESTREGIFVAGAFQGPKSIPASVIQAGGAAAAAAELLAPARGSLVLKKTYPEERTAPGEDPRIGVFLCHCGKNIAGVVDVSGLKQYAETLADVVAVEDNLYSCSQDTQALIGGSIAQHGLNRVVVAACTPRTHEPLFQDTLREAGLNKCLLEMVNIRDQCSWVQMQEKEAATRKAQDLVRMAVAKARLLEPLSEAVLEVVPRGLVIGGGPAGMTAALSLARQGFESYLVERAPELGGHLRATYFTLEGSDPQEHLRRLIRQVRAHPAIHVLTGTSIQEIEGYVGRFRTTVASANGEDQETKELEHGAIIVATGAEPYEPEEYLFGRHEKVLLQPALEERLALGGLKPEDLGRVVMIQCVGSREESHPYCSAVCCLQALKNALKIKALYPEAQVTILYRDMMTCGFREDYYTRARDRGVLFVRYRPDHKPRVEDLDGKIKVSVRDPLLKEDLHLQADLLVLSPALVPRENKALVEQLKVPLSPEGFFLEAHAQLGPVDSYVDGIYLCGRAQFPKPIDESLAQARAAAMKAARLLGRGYVTAEPIASSCQTDLCLGCGLCQDLCPYQAVRMTRKGKLKKAEVVAAACKGCGVCASSCPSRAMTMGRFTDAQITAQIEAFGQGA